jgi:hypothetical protein
MDYVTHGAEAHDQNPPAADAGGRFRLRDHDFPGKIRERIISLVE